MALLEKYLSKSTDTASRIIEGEAVIVLPQSSEVNTLNKIGTKIWNMANGNVKISEIISAIYQEYNVEMAHIKKDILEFINIMVTAKMLELSDQPVEQLDD